jgi:ferredoxin
VKVSIDPAKCMGHGMCYSLAPTVFADDEQGYGHVIGDGTAGPDRADAARTGAANCPEAAISLED